MQRYPPIPVYGQTRMPGAWLRVMAGLATTAAATGPLFIAVGTLWKVLWPLASTATPSKYADDPVALVSDSAVLSIAGLFLWLLNATVVGLLVRWRRDAVGWSLVSGVMMGTLIGIAASWWLMIDYAGVPDDLSEVGFVAWMAAPCAVTMALLAALYWRIAIRPRRQWRLRMESAEDAIRAME